MAQKKEIKFDVYDEQGWLKLEVRVNEKGAKAIEKSKALAEQYKGRFGEGAYVKRVKDWMSGGGHCDDCGAHYFVACGSQAVCPICGEIGIIEREWNVRR